MTPHNPSVSPPERGSTPTPWDVVPSCQHHGAYITSQFGTTLCDLYAMSDPSSLSVRNGGTSRPIPFTDADANAAFIVQAVNNHDELVAALRKASAWFAKANVPGGPGCDFLNEGGWDDTEEIAAQIDTALSKLSPSQGSNETVGVGG